MVGSAGYWSRPDRAETKDDSTGKIIPKECQMCNLNVDETQEHIMWECPCELYENERIKVRSILGKIARKMKDREEAKIVVDPLQWDPLL